MCIRDRACIEACATARPAACFTDVSMPGTDPAAERRASRKTVEWTFKKTAEAYIADKAPGWKNPKHRQQWENTCLLYTSRCV